MKYRDKTTNWFKFEKLCKLGMSASSFVPENSPDYSFLRTFEPTGEFRHRFSLILRQGTIGPKFLGTEPESGSQLLGTLPKFLLLVIWNRAPGSWKPGMGSVLKERKP